VIDADRWPDHVRLSDLEPKFTCQACGHRGADVRPLFAVERPSSGYPRPRLKLIALWHEACSLCSAGNFSVPVQE
jgi:hypothetical protein